MKLNMDIARQTDCKIAAAKQSSNGSILGLSNEIVCILAAQRAVKLPRQRVCLDSKSVCIVLTKILASIQLKQQILGPTKKTQFSINYLFFLAYNLCSVGPENSIYPRGKAQGPTSFSERGFFFSEIRQLSDQA